MKIALRVLAGLLWLAIGLAAAIVSAFLQAVRLLVSTPFGPWTIPWGLVLAWIALILLVRGAIWAMRTRWGGWAVVVGWLAGTILMSMETYSGDLAISAGGRQEVYLVGGAILGAFAAILPMRIRPVGSPPADGGTPVSGSSSEDRTHTIRLDAGTPPAEGT
jgi:hypothetical protein